MTPSTGWRGTLTISGSATRVDLSLSFAGHDRAVLRLARRTSSRPSRSCSPSTAPCVDPEPDPAQAARWYSERHPGAEGSSPHPRRRPVRPSAPVGGPESAATHACVPASVRRAWADAGLDPYVNPPRTALSRGRQAGARPHRRARGPRDAGSCWCRCGEVVDREEPDGHLVVARRSAAQAPRGRATRQVATGGQAHRRDRHLAQTLVGQADHRRLEHVGMLLERLLDLDRVDRVAAALDHVLLAAPRRARCRAGPRRARSPVRSQPSSVSARQRWPRARPSSP